MVHFYSYALSCIEDEMQMRGSATGFKRHAVVGKDEKSQDQDQSIVEVPLDTHT